jgi:phospholipid/cholesterol/gamma-HCH transport system substrate-binding protein
MPATKSDFTATEVKAGLFVLGALVILVVFVAAIRGCRPGPENVSMYAASFSNIAGLNLRADVRFGGVQVGQVTSIEPDPEDRAKILVTMEVADNIPVNRASVATIEQVSLTAEKHLEISTGSADAALLAGGDRIAAGAGTSGLIDMSQLEGVTSRLETLLDGLIVLVGNGPSEAGGSSEHAAAVDVPMLLESLKITLEDSAAAARELTGLIADNREGFGDVVRQLGTLETSANELVAELSNLIAENRQPLNASLVNVQRLTEDMSRQMDQLAASLTVGLRHLEDTGGNLSDFVDDQRPALEDIVRNLRDTTANLRRLSGMLADQPDALLRGRPTHGRQSGDDR